MANIIYSRPSGRDIFFTPPESMYSLWWLYLVLWVLFSLWGGSYIISGIPDLLQDRGVMHLVNLPFHEAGHILFGFDGEILQSMGGTLLQLLLPLVCGATLLWKRVDTFGASICLWWFGQNLIDISPYIADARAGEIPLLGGNTGSTSPYGFHDWEFILGETGLLAYDKTFAAISLNSGRLTMFAAIGWGMFLLWRAWAEKM